MDEQVKMTSPLTQAETNYIPLSITKGKACANCRFFCANGEYGDSCLIVQSWPETILPTGYCDRWETPPPLTDVDPIPVVIIEPAVGEMDSGQVALTPEKEGFVGKLVKRLLGREQKQSNAFTVYRTKDKTPHWFAVFSNNFEDRDGEIITDKAWDGYLKRVNMGFVPMPELWLGHIPGTKHGQATQVFAVGNFVCAVGTFDDTPEAKRAVDYYTTKGRDTPLSHGFTFPKWAFEDGQYKVINTFEISTLPPPLVAANPFTEYEVKDMQQITPEQAAALELVMGKDAVSRIDQLREQSEKIKEAGVNYKDFVDADAQQQVSEDTRATKALGELVGQLIEGQGELLTLVTAQTTSAKAQSEKNMTLEKQVKDLTAQIAALTAKLGDAPRRASEAPETKLSEADKNKLKEQLPVEYDPMFPGMNVPLEVK
jgi:hypothetical protein